jgi:hypothetical protein
MYTAAFNEGLLFHHENQSIPQLRGLPMRCHPRPLPLAEPFEVTAAV